MDIIYPPRCFICGEFLCDDQRTDETKGGLFCRACFSGFSRLTSPKCPVCAVPFITQSGEDHLCEACLRKRPHFEAAEAPYLHEGPLMDAIHGFKYGSRRHIGDSLGPLLAAFAGDWLGESRDILTMPVPLHPRRLRERGFNQSLVLARYVARKLDTALDFLSLRRVKYTTPQTGLGRKERRKNVKNAFQLKTPDAVEDRTILLVDDVFTTGNTLNECARVLKKGGCEKVLCLVLARAGGAYQ